LLFDDYGKYISLNTRYGSINCAEDDFQEAGGVIYNGIPVVNTNILFFTPIIDFSCLPELVAPDLIPVFGF
jgi:hypothetical protein